MKCYQLTTISNRNSWMLSEAFYNYSFNKTSRNSFSEETANTRTPTMLLIRNSSHTTPWYPVRMRIQATGWMKREWCWYIIIVCITRLYWTIKHPASLILLTELVILFLFNQRSVSYVSVPTLLLKEKKKMIWSNFVAQMLKNIHCTTGIYSIL